MFLSEEAIQAVLNHETAAERRHREFNERCREARRVLRLAVSRNSLADKTNPQVIAALTQLRDCTMRQLPFYKFERAYLEEDDEKRHLSLDAAYEQICHVVRP